MPREFTAIEPVPILFAYFDYKPKFDFESECFDDCIVIFICAGGRFEYSVGELDSGVAGVGDCVICPSGTALRRRILEPISLYVLRMTTRPQITDGSLPAGRIRLDEYSRILDDLSMIEADNIIGRFQPYEQSYLVDIWFTIMKQCGLLRKASTHCQDADMIEAARYIELNLHTRLTVGELAAQFGLTSVGFIRRFNAAYGTTPLRFIIAQRIQKAKRLLCTTDSPLAEVAELCGYENEYYFSNSFKKNTGEAPSTYRKSMRV